MTWSTFIPLLAFSAAPALQPAPDIPTVSAAELAPAAKPLLLPRHLPGFDLHVLDERKKVNVPTGSGSVEVQLPIYFYLPAPERREALRELRGAADELRRAAHLPDRAGVDLDGLLGRFERALAALGTP